jgi:hypothetical protein
MGKTTGMKMSRNVQFVDGMIMGDGGVVLLPFNFENL